MIGYRQQYPQVFNAESAVMKLFEVNVSGEQIFFEMSPSGPVLLL